MSKTEQEMADARRDALLRALLSYLSITVIEKDCDRCVRTGKWQDGGACAYCNGAGVKFDLLGGA